MIDIYAKQIAGGATAQRWIHVIVGIAVVSQIDGQAIKVDTSAGSTGSTEETPGFKTHLAFIDVEGSARCILHIDPANYEVVLPQFTHCEVTDTEVKNRCNSRRGRCILTTLEN